MLACTSRSFSAPRDPTKQVDLEEIVGQRVESFAFPYDNCAPETVSLVRDAGFRQACSVVATLSRKG